MAPDFDANIELCVTAWNDLNSCRGIGMSAGPIPFTAFEIWCRFHDLDYAIAIQVWAVIRHLDREHFEREQSKRRLEQQRR